MLKEKELQEMRPTVQYKDGQNITLQSIRSALKNYLDSGNIAVAFDTEQIKRGGVLGGHTEDCLVVYHPEHRKDYFSFAVTVKNQGTYAFVSVSSFGVSKLMNLEAARKQVNAAAKEGANYRGYNPLQNAAAGASFIAAGIMGVRHLAKGKSDKENMEIEQQWYSIICSAFDEIFK